MCSGNCWRLWGLIAVLLIVQSVSSKSTWLVLHTWRRSSDCSSNIDIHSGLSIGHCQSSQLFLSLFDVSHETTSASLRLVYNQSVLEVHRYLDENCAENSLLSISALSEDAVSSKSTNDSRLLLDQCSAHPLVSGYWIKLTCSSDVFVPSVFTDHFPSFSELRNPSSDSCFAQRPTSYLQYRANRCLTLDGQSSFLSTCLTEARQVLLFFNNSATCSSGSRQVFFPEYCGTSSRADSFAFSYDSETSDYILGDKVDLGNWLLQASSSSSIADSNETSFSNDSVSATLYNFGCVWARPNDNSRTFVGTPPLPGAPTATPTELASSPVRASFAFRLQGEMDDAVVFDSELRFVSAMLTCRLLAISLEYCECAEGCLSLVNTTAGRKLRVLSSSLIAIWHSQVLQVSVNISLNRADFESTGNSSQLQSEVSSILRDAVSSFEWSQFMAYLTIFRTSIFSSSLSLVSNSIEISFWEETPFPASASLPLSDITMSPTPSPTSKTVMRHGLSATSLTFSQQLAVGFCLAVVIVFQLMLLYCLLGDRERKRLMRFCCSWSSMRRNTVVPNS